MKPPQKQWMSMKACTVEDMQSPAGPYMPGLALCNCGQTFLELSGALPVRSCPGTKANYLGFPRRTAQVYRPKRDHQMAENYASQELRSVSNSQKSEITG